MAVYKCILAIPKWKAVTTVYVPTTFFLEKLLAQLIDHAVSGPYSGVLDGLYLGLGQTPTGTLNPSQGVSAITEATYDGYARQAITWHGPYTDALGAQAVQSAALYFTPTDATIHNSITSMFLADAITAGNLILSEIMPGGPIGMSGPANAFSIAVVFQMASGNDYGDVVVIQ
jgi:hypothetical protein